MSVKERMEKRMNKCYYRIFWENYPSDNTPLNEQNLNKIDVATDEMDNRIISLDSTKFDKSEAQLLVKYIEYDEDTGIFKITHYNGASYTIDTLLEKLAINFDYDYQTQRLIIALSDGTVKYVDLSALITQYEFLDSDTVAFTVDNVGKVTAIVKEGSIEEKHLRPNYLADIKVEVAKAQASQAAADASEKEAKKSENAAKASQIAAKASEDNAAGSAVDAAESESTATQKAADAAASAATATQKATEAETSATNADNSATNASNSASVAAEKATEAAESATTADTYAKKSQSYAVGGTGTRPGEDTDNAKKYYEQAKAISERLAGTLRPMGTVLFEDLPLLSDAIDGDMYNISNQFITTNDFAEGTGHVIPAGSNVYKTAEGFWDVLAGSPVTGVKGDKETSYRTGNVNITPENIGALPKDQYTQNSKLNEGYVAKGEENPNKVWGTDADGNPGWIEVSGGVYSEIPSVNGLKMEDGNVDFVVCNNAGDDQYKVVTKSEWTNAEGSRIRILFENGCTVASNLQVMPVPLSLALVKNTNGDPFLTNETGVIYEFTWYNAKLVLTGSTGGSVDPSDITPASIGAVAKAGDTMTGRLEIKTVDASSVSPRLITGDEGNQRIFYGSDSIESVTPDNVVGILKLNPEGNANNGRVVIGSPLHVAGGLSVDNALGNVYSNMRDFRFLPVFNGYTGDAGTGGIFGYLERKACGLAPFWHWATTNNYEAYYYKITVGAEDTDAEIVNWMISFELTVYQSYRYCKFAISGYVHYLHNTENNSYDLIWYEPRAEMIAGGREFNNLYVYFGKDTDGHLYVAINALSYTGLVIDTVNVAFQDIVVDYSNLFSLELVPTLDNTTKYANILTSRPFYLNEANELKNSVSNGKAMVASAITIKGVYTAADADFLTMANNIGNIYRGKKMIGSVVSSVRITSTQNTCTVSFSVSDNDLSKAQYVSVHIVAASLYITNATMSLSGDLVVGDSEWGKQTQTFAEIRKTNYMLTKKNNYSITLSAGGIMNSNYQTAILICYYGISF